MTEQEWLQTIDPQPMLEFLRGKVSERKFRLFLVACCRGLFDLFPEPYSRKAARTAERYADGEVSAEKLRFAWGSARRSATTAERERRNSGRQNVNAPDFVRAMLCLTVADDPIWLLWGRGSNNGSWWLSMARRWGIDLEVNEAVLLRCIFGNIFRPIQFDSAWLTWNDATIPKLAQAIYEERAFDRMPILADALEEAGCDNADILDHCRSGGEHVRGCWVIDALLGKS